MQAQNLFCLLTLMELDYYLLHHPVMPQIVFYKRKAFLDQIQGIKAHKFFSLLKKHLSLLKNPPSSTIVCSKNVYQGIYHLSQMQPRLGLFYTCTLARCGNIIKRTVTKPGKCDWCWCPVCHKDRTTFCNCCVFKVALAECYIALLRLVYFQNLETGKSKCCIIIFSL